MVIGGLPCLRLLGGFESYSPGSRSLQRREPGHSLPTYRADPARGLIPLFYSVVSYWVSTGLCSGHGEQAAGPRFERKRKFHVAVSWGLETACSLGEHMP